MEFGPAVRGCPAVRNCPEGAIVQDDSYSAPRIDQDLCTERGACCQVCRVVTGVSEEVGVH